MMRTFFLLFLTILFGNEMVSQTNPSSQLQLTNRGYYEMPGVNIMVFDDFYPEGHQGGVTIIQCGKRLAANGDIRLEDTPGQWSPIPAMGKKEIDAKNGTISVLLWYPDSSRNRKGFNPIEFPDLQFRYCVTTQAVGEGLKVTVTLRDSIPDEWKDKVGFNLEIFPGDYFGEPYQVDGATGIFPRQFNGRILKTQGGQLQALPMAIGSTLTLAPGNTEKQITIISHNEPLKLFDGRAFHNNGWFIVRSTFGKKSTIEWTILPTSQPQWQYAPVIQVSQVGFHPSQKKIAVVELDGSTDHFEKVELLRISKTSSNYRYNEEVVKSELYTKPWGDFLRFKYLQFDFSDVTDEGLYKICYGSKESHIFEINKNLYSTVWQPTLHTFLPVQMCHMRIEDRYKIWHGVCHIDDARMAPIDYNHFDGYYQGSSTLTHYKSGDHVTGLNMGGWHDAGDDDLRIESQAETVYKLALGYELFHIDYDETTIDQKHHVAQLHRPDGKPDVLQQIEHGVLSIVGAYESMGRLYRGIICPTLKQYVHLGDVSTVTDNFVYKPNSVDPILHEQLPEDDRWVFTEVNPIHEFHTAQALAAVSRVLQEYNPSLAAKCLTIAQSIYNQSDSSFVLPKYKAAAELYFTTRQKNYKDYLYSHSNVLTENLLQCAEVGGRVVAALNDSDLYKSVLPKAKELAEKLQKEKSSNPYNIVYHPRIWGVAWDIQSIAVQECLLSIGFPEIFGIDGAIDALNFILGCHPGENTASFVSGVGVHSLTVAYGANRDDWSYIPGGISSGTALIRPDFPELKTWPYFWQQTEYVLGGGTADFLFLSWAIDHYYKR